MSERIISLTSENIKRLKAIHITPNGHSVEIAGRNGAGKSSVLDSIWYALAGRSVLPDRPIRDGESRAEVTVELENYTVTRSFTAAGGGTLKVTPKVIDGKPIPSPQAFLDGLLSTLTFDPFEFTRLKESEQGETLRKLLRLDFSEAESRHKSYYDRRTIANRKANEIQVQLNLLPPADTTLTSDAPVVLADILAQRGAAIAHNKENESKRDNRTKLDTFHQSLQRQVDQLQKEILEIENQLRIKRATHEDFKYRAEDARKEAQAFAQSILDLQDRDLRVFDEQILAAESHNARLKNNQERAALIGQLALQNAESASLTQGMETIERDKAHALATAKFPLPGLSFSATGGVAYNGIPFSQISTAEQIRVSTAIGLSLNPGLKVIFIRNGSLIDDAGIRTLCELAKAVGAQIWIERVGALSGELPGVVIEDGAVVDSTVP